MPKPIFDQDRPRSTMAQRLDEAFAGCEEWTVIAAPRRSTLDFQAPTSSRHQVFDGAESFQPGKPRAL